MSDQISLGSAPVNEECVQFGAADYISKALHECTIYKEQLERQFNESKPMGCRFKIVKCPYESSFYYDVVIEYDNNIAEVFAERVEDEIPNEWDSLSKSKLKDDDVKFMSPDELGVDVMDYMWESVVPACCSNHCEVEPDGTCEHGFESILLHEGLI